jgi:hypothetical protein
MEMQDPEFAQLVCCLAWVLQLSDWMILRELWTFNIVETAIDYGDFGSWTKCILHYGMFRYSPNRLIFLKSLWGPGSGT